MLFNEYIPTTMLNVYFTLTMACTSFLFCVECPTVPLMGTASRLTTLVHAVVLYLRSTMMGPLLMVLLLIFVTSCLRKKFKHS